jgi:ribonuclease BN (tRNA processing enzyme)
MRLTVVGSGTGLPLAERGSPCLVVQEEGTVLVLDAGPGSLRELVRTGVDPRRVAALLLTHPHLDHLGDLPAWLFAFRNPAYAREVPLVLGGGPWLGPHLALLGELHGRQVAPPEPPVVADLLRGALTLGAMRVEALPVAHAPGSLGFRITSLRDGGVAAYGGDAEETEELVALGRDADLFVLECSLPDGSPAPGHLTPAAAGRVIRGSGCRRALLTHFYPGWDPRGALPAAGRGQRVEAAVDGFSLEVVPLTGRGGATGAGSLPPRTRGPS